MVDFWSNLLNVSLYHDEAIYWRMDYDRVIRAHALTTFESLLQAAITHPAMGLYLDNAISSKEAPNENLGRELLELHTVGVDAGYTEDDVKASARMLTGYRVDLWWPSFRAFYDTDWHDTQPVQVMGFSHANRSADGRPATLAYLTYLARHPATANRLARRLCVKFVSDEPTAAIVKAVAKAYRRPRHRDQADAAGPRQPSRTSPPGRARRCACPPRTTSPPFGPSASGRRSRPTTTRSPTRWSGSTARPASRRTSGPRRTATPRTTARGRAQAGCSPASRSTATWPPGGGPPTRRSSRRTPRCCRRCRRRSCRSSTTRPYGCSARGPATPYVNGVAQLLGMPLTRRLTKDEALDYWVLRGILSSLLDSPLHLHR